MKILSAVVCGLFGLTAAFASQAGVPVNPETLALDDAVFTYCGKLQPRQVRHFAELRRALFAGESDGLDGWKSLPNYVSSYRLATEALSRAPRGQLVAACAALAETKVAGLMSR